MSHTIKDDDASITYVNTGLSAVYLKSFLDPNNNTAIQHEVTRNMAGLVVSAATKTTMYGIKYSITDANQENYILLPVLRAALPMYVVAQTTFPKADTVLVRCTKNKRMMGENSVEVHWMGRNIFADGSDLRDKIIFLMDTVIATGDTILKLLDEINAPIVAVGTDSKKCPRCVTILTCYISPQALARIKGHHLVKNIIIGAVAESVDSMGFIVPSTGGDIGDKLFGKDAKRK